MAGGHDKKEYNKETDKGENFTSDVVVYFIPIIQCPIIYCSDQFQINYYSAAGMIPNKSLVSLITQSFISFQLNSHAKLHFEDQTNRGTPNSRLADQNYLS